MVKAIYNPALQERSERIDAGGVNLAAHILASAMPYALVIIVFVEQSVAGVLIGRYERNIIGNSRTNEAIKRAKGKKRCQVRCWLFIVHRATLVDFC